MSLSIGMIGCGSMTRGHLTGLIEQYRRSEQPRAIKAADDTGMALVRFTNGCMGQWTESRVMHGQPFGHTVIYGSHGSINDGALTVEDGEEKKTLAREDITAQYRPEAPFPMGITNAVTLEPREFFECIQHGGPRPRWTVMPVSKRRPSAMRCTS